MSQLAQEIDLIIPRDVVEIYYEVGWYLEDFDDCTAESIQEWRDEFRDAYRKARSGQPVDWQAVRESLNEICDDGGYPHLF